LQATVAGAGDVLGLLPLANEALDGLAVALRKLVFDRNAARADGVAEVTLVDIANEAGISKDVVALLDARADRPANPDLLSKLGAALGSGAASLLANAAVSDLELKLANEREARAEMVVDAAILSGAVLVGDRDARVAELANATDFAATAADLATA